MGEVSKVYATTESKETESTESTEHQQQYNNRTTRREGRVEKQKVMSGSSVKKSTVRAVHTHASTAIHALDPSRPSSVAAVSSSSVSASASASDPLHSLAGESILSAAASCILNDAFELRPLLWQTIASSTSVPEHTELRRMLGEEQLEKNSSLDEEIRALVSIVTIGQQREYRRRVVRQEEEEGRRKKESTAAASSSFISPSSSSSSILSTRPSLPDSGARQFLSHEITTLLSALRQNAVKSGILSSTTETSQDEALLRVLPRPQTARQKKVMTEVVQNFTREQMHHGTTGNGSEDAASTSRPSSSTSRPSTATRAVSIRPSTSRTRSSTSSTNSTSTPEATFRGGIETDAGETIAAIESLSATLMSSLTAELDPQISPQQVTSNSSPVASSSSSSSSTSTTDTILTTLRSALKEEESALLQDITYLQACLELEIEQVIEQEMEEKEKDKRRKEVIQRGGGSAPHSSSTISSSSSSSPPDDPISIQELREFNTQLKEAVQQEEQRAKTLALMNGVESRSTGAGGVRAVTSAPSSNSAFRPSSSSSSNRTPIKATHHKIPSLLKERTPSFSLSTSHNMSLNGDGEESESDHESRPTSALPPSVPSSSPSALDILMSENADLFGLAPPPQPQAKPTIPNLSFNGISVSNVDKAASSSPSSIDTPQPTARPMTARTSKLRSRLEAAQQFHQATEGQ